MGRPGLRMILFAALLARFGNADGICLNLNDVTEVLKLGREVVTDALESWEIIKARGPGAEDDEFPFVRGMERRLVKRIGEVTDRIDAYQAAMELRVDSMLSQLVRRIPMRVALESRINGLEAYVGQVNAKYEDFVRYTDDTRYERFTLEKFAESCTSNYFNQLPDVLKSIHRLLVPQRNQLFDRSLLVMLANEFQEASSHICNERQSPQQLLYNLYTAIALTEIKGYAMIQFSYTLLRLYQNGTTYNEEMNTLKQQYSERTYETLRAVKTAMSFAPRDLWRCDPVKHELGETYTELRNLFQGYIVNEVDLNAENTCRENCAYYSYAKVYSCFKDLFCTQQRRCMGKVLDCEYIDSDMWICPSDRKSSRRYEYVQYENGKNYGKKDTCRNPTTKVDSWWRWLFWHCSYCFCYCDEHTPNSERYVNLREVVSDVRANRVVTGMKFVKENRMIHVQIQEGDLLPKGGINATSVAWKPIDKYSITDRDVRNGVDFHTLEWEKRAIDLDDLVSPSNHILTGVRFRIVGTRLNLEIRASPFNFSTGELISPEQKSYWISNDVTDRTELKLQKPDVPIRSALTSIPDSRTNQYVNFAPSDREKDAAQSTVPFLDIQPVVPTPLTPISGAGVYHKGRDGSGGFLAIKLITYDFGPHLKANVPPTPPLIETPNEIRAV